MYQRPKFGESDEDLLKLQEEFIKHKAETDFKLASTLVSSKSKDDSIQSAVDNNQMEEVQEHLDNTFEDIPKIIKIGNIIEKKPSNRNSQFKSSRSGFPSGFPQPKRRDVNVTLEDTGRSIFSQQTKKFKSNNIPDKSADKPMDTTTLVIKENVKFKRPVSMARSSAMPTCSKSSEMTNIQDEIHMENLDRMNKMTPEEILEEREKLMSTLDPAIIAFLKSKHHHNQPKVETRQPTIAQQNKPVEGMDIEEIECTKDILSLPNSEKWIHFDELESNKLAWMKDVKKPEVPKDEKYEARFDFAGWLLPYVQEEEINDENRILYHHGEEPGRPGYTLQELFQLCRSNVMQQKIIALNTIAAILNLYSSGIYDHIIDIPIEQVFFVLRFCLDENSPATLNSSIKATRNLFCSQIDETCLDCLLGFGLMPIQPILAVDEDSDDSTVNDQQLAESNLVKCLVRSGILIRIRYILTVVKPTETETVIHCLDILIRLARDSDFVVEQLWKFDGLIDSIVRYFVPKVFATVQSTSGYDTPIVQAIKLLRILSSRSQNIAEELVNKYRVLESVATYLSNELLSLNTAGLKLQIETLQLWEQLVYYKLGIDDFKNLRPVLLKLLDYHLKNTNVDASWTIQTHIGALLSLLAQVAMHDYQCVLEYVKMIFENGLPKWTTQFSHLTVYSCGKLQLITSLFNLLSVIFKYQLENAHLPWENVYKLIDQMIASEAFNMVTSNIKSSSNILNNYEVHQSSPNLLFSDCAVWNTTDHIVPVLHTKSSIPFLNKLTEFIETSNSNKLKLMLLNNANINSYMKTIQMSHNFYMTSNWYTKIESKMTLNVLNISVKLQRELDTSLYFEVAVKSLCVYTGDQKQDVELLFKNIIFCPTFYPSEVLLRNLNLTDENLLKSSLEEMFNIQKVYVDVLGLQQNLPNLTTKRALNVSLHNIMPLDWVYSPIIALYSNTSPSKVPESTQNFIISNCLRWVYIYEIYFPDLANMINATDKFCRLSCTFLGSDTLFLIPEIQLLLTTCLQQILEKHEQELDFDKAIHGLTSFQDLYIQLLEQYQGVSYGDKLFGQFILVPLAQRHNVKFRKAIWSEYAGIIQIFNVTEKDLMVDVNKYLEPLESDLSLLKCYQKIISVRAVRPTSIFYKVAKHHVDGFRNMKKEEDRIKIIK